MKPAARKARNQIRQMTRTQRAASRARRQIATGAPQTARTHLVAAGLDDATAKRFAGAFSARQTPTATATTKVKLKGRRTKRVTVKLYDSAAFTARLATYRPKDKTAAARFERIAHHLAA